MNTTLSAVQEASEAEEDSRDAGRSPRAISLRTKGILAFALLVGYTVLIGLITNMERENLLRMVERLEQVHRDEERLIQINTSMARTLLAVNVAFSAEEPATSSLTTLIEIEATLSLIEAIENRYPAVLILSGKLHALVNDLMRAPNRGVLAIARSTLNDLIVELDSITHATHAERLRLLADYRKTYDRITLQGLAMLVIGLIVLGAATAIFFSRLTWDIRKLESHALGIVSGDRGSPLPVTRSDELGNLMHAVNQLQHDLRERERQINRARQEQFHREKMAAVGSLAAQLAHEINNPIAAITGVASSIDSVRQSDQCQFHGNHACEPGLILEQARRISAITRQIADFTRPQPSHAELVDVNQIIRSTCSFVSYDRRFRGIALNTELDGDLPAIHAVADHISQVLMNVLINAADALEEMPAGHSGVIAVTTRTDADGVVIEVADNGKGIDATTLERVFDEYFTTKPAGKGTGLGLALCRELVRDAGGTITLSSAPGSGTTVRVSLPQGVAEHAAVVRARA